MAQGERRMLIDGELVLADWSGTFDNVNPATEEVLGDVADASAAEMHRATDAGPASLRRERLVDEPRLRLPAGVSRHQSGGVARWLIRPA